MIRIRDIMKPIVFVAVLALLSDASWAGEPELAEPVRSGIVPVPEAMPPEAAEPVRSEWTHPGGLDGRHRPATSEHHRWYNAEEGRSGREHVVNNPRGEMRHTWDRVDTDEGYQYRRTQTWTAPDGTPIRQHEHTLSGTDPHNYTREHSLTLPDGRTLQQTHVRSWDGTEGTMERSFVGPNGQTQHFQRSWSPDDAAGEPAYGRTPPMRPAGAPPEATRPVAAPAVAAPAVATPTEKGGWWQKWNPFGEGGRVAGPSAAASAPRRGFTIGTGNAASAGGPPAHARPQARPARPTPSASRNAHRPSWAGGVPRSVPHAGSPSRTNAPAAAARANPGRGNRP